MKISILSPTIRPKGLEITQEYLQKQTFSDFEWLTEVGLPKQGNDLSRAWNKMLRRAKGKYIVFLEDYIKIPEDGLKKFLDLANEKRLITGSVGKTLDIGFSKVVPVKYDWREKGQFREISYDHFEIDWAIAPLEAIKEIGGFDEEYDNFWSNENVELAYRLNRKGYSFWVLPDNKAIQWDHDRFLDHPFRDTKTFEKGSTFHAGNLQAMEINEKPIERDYL